MKTPSSRSDPPVSRGEGGYADHGDDAADPKLQAIRQVWLEMREQEPPERGMVELLAAARAKAQAMQPRPAWYQRLLAALRRPAVLAFATVVVLVSGAVLVTRRFVAEAPMQLESPSGTAERARAPTVDLGADGAGPAVTAAVDHRAPVTAAPVDRDPAPVAPEGRGEAGGWFDEDGSLRAPNAEPPADRKPAKAAPSPPERRPSLRQAPRAPKPAPPAPPTATTAREEARGADLEASAAREAVATPDDAPSKSAEAALEERTSGLRGRSDATLATLYRRCAVAAERGDCAAVRRLVAQITTRDPAYRSRLARGSAVARCLAN